MIDDRAYEEKKENVYEEWLVLFVFVRKSFISFYLMVGEESVGNNIVDNV